MAGRKESSAAAQEGPGTRGAEVRTEPPASAPTPGRPESSPTPDEGGRKVERRKPGGCPMTAAWHRCLQPAGRTPVRSTPAGDGSGRSRRGRW